MENFQVRIEKRWDRATVQIYLFRPTSTGEKTVVARPTGKPGIWRNEEVELGAKTEPSLELPLTVFEQIIEEASDFFPPSAATDRHLSDTVAVRDRLLALVEGLTHKGRLVGRVLLLAFPCNRFSVTECT